MLVYQRVHLLIFYRIFYGIFHTQVERISRNLNPVECWRSPVVNTGMVLDQPSPVPTRMLYSGPTSFNRLNLNIGPSCTSLLSECCFSSLQPQNHGELTTPKTSHPHLPTLGSKISYLNDCLRYTLSNMHRHVDLNLNTGHMMCIYIYYLHVSIYDIQKEIIHPSFHHISIPVAQIMVARFCPVKLRMSSMERRARYARRSGS